MARTNYVKAALMMPANLAALAAAAVSSAVVTDPLPMLVALGFEGLYLGVIPGLKRFQRAVRAQGGAEDAEAERAAGTKLLGELAPSQREHYQALAGVRDRILDNYRKLPGGRVLVAQSESRLDALLNSFLRLVTTLNQYRVFLNAADRKQVEAELRALEADAAAEPNPRLRDVKARRVDILRRRLQRFTQAEESREVVSHQIAGIEDLLRLTHEQSIAIRDPESVNRQLEALSLETQATEETVREMERFMEFQDEASVFNPPAPVRTR